MARKNRTIQILLIEDNLGDVRLTQEAFKEASTLEVEINAVNDGVEAIDFLRKKGHYSSAVTPDLILLDLNLPRKDGREVLAEIKNDENLKHIPVIVLTTSIAHEDILTSYRLHANCYINKPVDFDNFYDVIQKVEAFWLSTTILPTMI